MEYLSCEAVTQSHFEHCSTPLLRCEELGSHPFTKLCVECKLVNGKTVTRATCDIVWYRARAELEGLQAWKRKNMEYITPKMLYPQFLFALMHLAAKRKSGFQEVGAHHRTSKRGGMS